MKRLIKNLIAKFILRNLVFLPITRNKYQPIELIKKRFFVCYNLIKKNNFKNILEIGSYRGDLTYFILKNLPLVNLTSIDPYIEYNAENKVNVNEKLMNTYKDNLLKSLAVEISNNRFKLIQKMSSECYNLFSDKSFDFIFIDGDHSYEACLSDLNNYYNKVRDGGVICIHDYNRKTVPGVKLAVDEFASKNQLNLINDLNYCVYFYK